MSKSAVNPFLQVDFSKFADFSKFPDFSKFGAEMKVPMNMEPFFAAQRRNIEAFTAVNQATYESWQSLCKRQAEMMRTCMEDCTNMMSTMMSSPSSPEEKMLKQAEASKAVAEKCLANCKDVAETVNKCNAQAFEAVSNRLNESIEELRGMMKTRQVSAA